MPSKIHSCPLCPPSPPRRFLTRWNMRRHVVRVHQMDVDGNELRPVGGIKLRRLRRHFGDSGRVRPVAASAVDVRRRTFRPARTPPVLAMLDPPAGSPGGGSVQPTDDDVEPAENVVQPTDNLIVRRPLAVDAYDLGSPMILDASSDTDPTPSIASKSSVVDPTHAASPQATFDLSFGGTSSLWGELAATTTDHHCLCDVLLELDGSTLSTPPTQEWTSSARASTPVQPSPTPLRPYFDTGDGSDRSTSASDSDLLHLVLTPPTPFRDPCRPIYEDISIEEDREFDTTPLLDERDYIESDGRILTPPSGIRWLPKNLGTLGTQ